MTNLIKATKLQDVISEIQMQINIHKSTAQYYEEKANQLEQDYYNKACGCSVKAQENNLFDYKSQLKN